MNFVPTLLSL